MRNIVVSLALSAVGAAVCVTPLFADETTTCEAVGPSMLSFSSGVNGAVIAAAKATLAASSLPGTTPKGNPDFKVVREQSAKVETEAATALSGLGPLVGANFGVPTVQKASDAVTIEGRNELQEALSLARLSHRLGQIVATRHEEARRLALASALRAFGSSVAISTTNGSVGGQAFAATTVTRSPSQGPPIQIPPDASIEQTAEALDEAQSRLLLLPYTFNPLVNRWTAACREAHQLPPAPLATAPPSPTPSLPPPPNNASP